MIGIIGGSGIYNLSNITVLDRFEINTPFGTPSDLISKIKVQDQEMLFLPRHGSSHSFAPTQVNYRANICAMKMLGAKGILSFSACGSLREEFKPGDFVLVDQFIDHTKMRASTFFDESIIAHVGMGDPSCEALREILSREMLELGISFHKGGSYIAIEGPQFSSKKESLLFKDVFKCDVIGMTNMPEAKLAREAELCYQTVAMVTDFDCWKEDEAHVTFDEIQKIFKDNLSKVENILNSIASKLTLHCSYPCPKGCNSALENALVTNIREISQEVQNNYEPLLKNYLDNHD